MPDVLVIGGGFVGLSLAYELAGQGVKVQIVDRGDLGREASWAAAGILPPCKFRMRAPPVEWLAGFSGQLHAEWASRLREETGIDNGYRRCGGIYLAGSDGASAELLQTCERWRREGLTVKWLHAADLDRIEPALAGAYDRYRLSGAAIVEEESQIRSPRHLQALIAACLKRGVQITPGVAVHDFRMNGDRVQSARTNTSDFSADQFVIAAGAWSQPIAERLKLHIPVKPIRGQIVLLKYPQSLLQRIINMGRETMQPGRQYLIARDDGRILVGSTLEDVGFDRRNTAVIIADLLRFATDLVPSLKTAEVDRCWTGLRPASIDDLPYLGRVPGVSNALVATGHYRAGLYLAPGTAVLLSRVIRGESPGIDMTPFSPSRATRAENRSIDVPDVRQTVREVRN